MDLALGAPSFDLLPQISDLLVAQEEQMLCPCIVLAQFSDESIAIANGFGKRLDHDAADVCDVGDVAHCVFALRVV